MSTNEKVFRPDGSLAGWVSHGGCANPECLRAMKAGRMFHATPSGFAVTLPDYHFKTEAEAVTALVAAPKKVP